MQSNQTDLEASSGLPVGQPFDDGVLKGSLYALPGLGRIATFSPVGYRCPILKTPQESYLFALGIVGKIEHPTLKLAFVSSPLNEIVGID